MLKLIFVISLFITGTLAIAREADRDCNTSGKIYGVYQAMDAINCKSLNVGSAQTIKDEHGSYRLTKISKDKFKIEINPIFYTMVSNKMNTFSPSSESQQKYSDKMNACFNLLAPFLKGPDNKKIEIHAVGDRNIPPVNINIQSGDYRSNNENFQEEINCPTIFHETLHLLGLEDEYRENTRGYIRDPMTKRAKYVETDAKILAYDCRAIGPADSIMSDPEGAVLSVIQNVKREKTTCICAKSESRCLQSVKKNESMIGIENRCPPDFDSQTIIADGATVSDEKKYLGPDLNAGRVWVDHQKFTNFNLAPKIISRPFPPKKSSLLLPAHFRMITNPMCMSENKKYKECTESAYQSSIVDGACSKAAKKCQSNTDWLN
jgi:hypothetical protein